MTRRHLAIIVVNMAVFVLFAEIAALILYYGDTGALFYVHRKAHRSIPETTGGRLTADGLHPYFGPIHTPGYRDDTNNFGLSSPHDFPFARTREDQFLIGIFGGSVGVWFCRQGADRLVGNLKQHEFFEKRQVIPLCLSHEGYKQPQQVLLLAYFLAIGQQFDLVINIDGFNEVALASLNHQRGLDISMPSPMHLDPLINLVDQSTLTPEKLYALAAIDSYKERLNQLVETIRRNRIASVNFVLEQYHRRAASRYDAEVRRFAGLPSNRSEVSVIRVTPGVKAREGAMLFEDIAENWATSTVLMNDMLRANGIAYFHLLQPNQYHTRRRFGDEERRVALNEESPFAKAVRQGYPLLVKASQSSTLATVNFLNGIHIFDDEPSPVYIDDCCHYTESGNHRLADFLSARILSARGSWSTPAEEGGSADGAAAGAGGRAQEHAGRRP